MKKCVCILLSIIVIEGCSSWKFEGHLDNGGTSKPTAALRERYAISALDMKISANEYYSLAFGKNPVSCDDLVRCRPDVFVSIPAGESHPNAVRISVFDQAEEYSKIWTLLVPYAVSLCILPTWLDCVDIYEVKVVKGDCDDRRIARFRMIIDTESKVTGNSPIGLISYAKSENSVSCRAHETVGIMQILCDQARRDRREVFLETLAYGVVQSLSEMEEKK